MTPSVDRLRHNILFDQIDGTTFDSVKKGLRERRHHPGDIIVEDESEGEELYLIAEGRVRIVKQGRFSEEKLLALLHPGDFFGELELVDGRPRSARVIAMDECVTYSLHKPEFERLLSESHPFAIRLLQVLSIRLRSLNNHFVSELERNALHSASELSKLEWLVEASRVLNSTLDLDRLLDIILELALKIVNGDRGTVYLVDESKGELWSRVLRGSQVIRLPLGSGIAGYVGATGDTLKIDDAYLDPRFNPDVDRRTGYHTRTILCMPMKNKDGKIIGVFQLLNKKSGLFTHDDESIIAALSVHAAVAVENARLYEEEKALLSMREEVRLAAKIQHDLLPKDFPHVHGYDIAGRSLAAHMVGGDSYDCIPITPRRLAICLGDVSGKGLPAALLMANVQATLRAQTTLDPSARECLARSNTLLFRSTSSDKFVTLFYSILDTETHQLQFTNAGHDPPILYATNGDIRRLKTGGIVLGIMEDYPFEQETVSLAPSDVLVIYSDGVAEAMNAQGEQFGENRLTSVIRNHHGKESTEIIELIVNAVNEHTAGHPQYDDMTLVVVKRLS